MIDDNTVCEVLIDWLQYTCSEVHFPDKWINDGIEEKRGLDFYTHMTRHSDGRIVLRNPDRPDMRNHVIMSSGALGNLAQMYGANPFEIVANLSKDSKVSRIDVALDIRNGCFDFDILAYELELGYAETNAEEYNRFQGLSAGGDTIYVGSAKSKKRLRIYDKAAEMGMQGILWTRVELQSRQKYAQAVVKKITADGISALVIPSLIMGFCDFPANDEWKQVFYGLPIAISVPRPESDGTLAWLIKQVAPCLARLERSKPHLNAYAVFNRAYHENLAKIDGKL